MKSKYALLVTIPETQYAHIYWSKNKKAIDNANKSLTNCYHKVVRVSDIHFSMPDLKIEDDGIISYYRGDTALLLHRLYM